jgi:hypothetical protein
MQQILNSKDRNQAFLKFVALFLVTVTVVVLAVYFDYRLPVRENRALLDEVSLQRQQDADQAKFAAKMQEVIVLLDSMDKPGVNAEQLDLQLGGKLTDLNILQLKDNTAYGAIDKAVVEKLSELQQKNKEETLLREKANRTDNAEAQVNTLQSQIAQLQQTVATYQHH